MYSVIDIKTGDIVGRYASSKRAYRIADRLDLHFGAVRFVVKLS